MGGRGSGRRPGFADTLDDRRAVELAWLRRQGSLKPGCSSTLRWSRCGRETASIGLLCVPDALILSYQASAWDGSDPEQVEERVPLLRTAQTLGGERTWFACPGCGRRCGVLYGGRRFRCRRCTGLPYGSQREAVHERLLRRVQALRVRLGGSGSTLEPFPPRPKRMRRQTYWRLQWQADTLSRAMWAAAAERFGIALDEIMD